MSHIKVIRHEYLKKIVSTILIYIYSKIFMDFIVFIRNRTHIHLHNIFDKYLMYKANVSSKRTYHQSIIK